MSANLDMSNNRANFAFTGSRKSIWHRQGQELAEGMAVDQWAQAAGLAHTVNKVQAYAEIDGVPSIVPDTFFLARGDTGAVLSPSVTDRYQVVQPRQALDFAERYVSVDSRFKLSTAGALDGGRTIFVCASYNGDLEIAREKHSAYLILSTSYDATMSTRGFISVVRPVCQNTISAAWSDAKNSMVQVRHSTKFDASVAGKQLAALAKSATRFKEIGDAMADCEMSREMTAEFFASMLKIDQKELNEGKVSTRKLNMLSDLGRAYQTSVREGAPDGSAWAALQAVTRFVDHDRSTRGADNADDGRFYSANFGSGNAMKGEAMGLLLPRIKDRLPVAA